MIKDEVRERKNEREWLSWICDSKTAEELRVKYDTWADSYDRDLEKDWGFMPANLALTLEKLLPDKNAEILDAGAGTGMMGEALVKQGYQQITAADLSEGMMEVAKKKQVYKALYACNLEESVSFCSQESFDGVIAAGLFAYAHAGVKVLNNLFQLLKPGGVFLLTIRDDYRNEIGEGFEKLPWQLLSQEEFPIYDDGRIMYLLGLRKERSQ